MIYNKIQVAFGALKKITGPPLQWQYNEKQILVVTGLDLPEYYAVDFCNEGDADTITMTASASGVEIPDQFLLTGKKLVAYIVVVDGESVNTVGQITFPVNARSGRTDISPTPAEQQQIDELIDLLNKAAMKAIPEGGLAGQVLSKKTDDDYDTEWVDQSGGGGGGTTNYNRLTNKPQINGVELTGNKSTDDLNIDAGGISFNPEEDYDEGTVGAELSQQKNAISQKAPLIINSASGNIATFADGADGGKIKKIVGMIVTPEGGSGCTGANIYHSDGNMICAPQGEWYQTFIPAGTPVSASVEKGSQSTIYYYRKDKTYIDYWTLNVNRGNRYGRTFAPQEDVYYVKFDGGTNATVRKGSALYDYLPYANVLPINWQAEAGTILNGTVTLNEDRSADVVNIGTGDSYHLTGVGNLSTYYGVNNVWIDTGAITECDYPADTKLYVDGLTAPDEDMIANANIASGKYFVVNNQLYLSTAAIAAGASIVPGTNCTATNLAEALNALNT